MAKLQCARCLRHGNDVDRVHLFLCADCATLYGKDAFRGTPPLFQGMALKGRCESCDKLGEISYWQWLNCGYCARIVHSYRMGRISAAFALGKVREIVQPQVPQFAFQDADPIIIQATARRGRTRELATKLDFEALDKMSGSRAFWIELKTGPGAIGEDIAEFQLDCSDCDDIMNTVNTSALPALLAHCQVAKHPEPPTMRIAGVKVWWTDLESFAKSFKEVRARRGNERKQAAYFETDCFRELGELTNFLKGEWLVQATKAISKQGCPVLYRK